MATQEEIQRIHDLRGQGETQKSIADRIGKSRSYVQKVLATTTVASRSVSRNEPIRAGDHVRRLETEWSKADDGTGDTGFDQILPAPDNIGEWASFGLDANTWRALGRDMTLPVLSSVSPGISRAIWDYLRMLDPGFEISIFKTGTEEVDERAKAVLDTFIADRIERRYTSLKGMFQQMFMGALYRGAFCVQLVTDNRGKRPLDILVPDPLVVKFKPYYSEDTGSIWEPGITIEGKWHSVMSDRFQYVAIDPLPGQPYGRSMIAPASFPSIFIIGLLYDLRRVVAQQGYSRIDVTIIGEKLRAFYPKLKDDQFQKMLDDLVERVASSFANMEPDDQYVHSDAITVNRSTGSLDGAIVAGAVQLIETLERMEVRALKTMPLLMGISDGVSEANANRQWEIFVQGIKSLQQHAEIVTQNVFKKILQIEGIQADILVRFAEIRSAEMLRDETTAKVKMENAAFAEDRKWISHEEAAIYATGAPPSEDIEDDPEEPAEPTDDEPTVDEPEDVVDDGDPVPASERYIALRRTSRVARREVGRRHVDRAVSVWEREMRNTPEKTILRAMRVSTFEEIPDDSETDWYWVEETREFVYRKSDRLGTAATRDILDRFRERQDRAMRSLIRLSDAVEGRSSAGWKRDVRELMNDGWDISEDTMIASMILGRGGVDGMTPEAYGDADALISEQEEYWEEFETTVLSMEGEEDVEGFLDGRMPIYLLAGIGFYERGRSRSWGLDIDVYPPLHPHCNCHMEYGEDLLGAYATWTLSAGSCSFCRDKAMEYDRFRG